MLTTTESKILKDKGTVSIVTDMNTMTATIVLTGEYTEETVREFFKKYSRAISRILVKKFNLVIDCYLLSMIKSDLLPGLVDAYKAYREFKSVTFINPYAVTGRMQLQRVARENGHLDFFKFMDKSEYLDLQENYKITGRGVYVY